jgi:D-serine deaminase-like pyridoxal phosphate-dependent protein
VGGGDEPPDRGPCDRRRRAKGAGLRFGPASGFEFEAACEVYTELQCGSYIFMDADYGKNGDRDGAPTKAFEPRLYVWATVMTRPAEERTIVDAGLKGPAFDSRPPLVCHEPAATYERASDEHGRLAVSATTNRLGLGDKIRLIPGHCDSTVNLYDWYICVRGNPVEQVWQINSQRGGVLTLLVSI